MKKLTYRTQIILNAVVDHYDNKSCGLELSRCLMKRVEFNYDSLSSTTVHLRRMGFLKKGRTIFQSEPTLKGKQQVKAFRNRSLRGKNVSRRRSSN